MDKNERIAKAKDELNKALAQYDGTLSYMRKYREAMGSFEPYRSMKERFPVTPEDYESFRAEWGEGEIQPLLGWNLLKGWAKNIEFLDRRIDTLQASRDVIADAFAYLEGMDPNDPLLDLPGFYMDFLEAMQIGLSSVSLSDGELYAFIQ